MFKSFYFILLFVVIITTMIYGEVIVPPLNNVPCNMIYKCSNVENVVWATDDVSCFVLRNPCYLGLSNCLREMRREEALRMVLKETCQELCQDFCTQEYRPICAVYNGIERSFSNECNMYSHICKSGQTYSIRGRGACLNDGKELFY